jgi:protein disulfide-isomerase A6
MRRGGDVSSAPWCGHCQKLTPEWKKAAKELEGAARLGAVDCDDADNKGLCSKYDVKGFPTIKVFGEEKDKPSDYQQVGPPK